MEQAVNEIEAARLMSVSVQTLRNWRSTLRGPKYLKLGRSVRYSIADLEKWMQERTINPERAYDDREAKANH